MTFKSRLYDYFIAGRYDRNLAEITDEFRDLCLDRIGLRESDVVLDLGCGTGLNQPKIAGRLGTGGRIIGVDASTQMLAQAQKRAEEQGYADRLQLILGDLRKLPDLVAEPVDAVMASLIFSVVPDWRIVFAHSFNVLKPGGRYGIMDNYWPDPSLRLRLACVMYAADATRPGFDPLEQVAEDFTLEYHPPDAEIQFYIAHGTKPL